MEYSEEVRNKCLNLIHDAFTGNTEMYEDMFDRDFAKKPIILESMMSLLEILPPGESHSFENNVVLMLYWNDIREKKEEPRIFKSRDEYDELYGKYYEPDKDFYASVRRRFQKEKEAYEKSKNKD